MQITEPLASLQRRICSVPMLAKSWSELPELEKHLGAFLAQGGFAVLLVLGSVITASPMVTGLFERTEERGLGKADDYGKVYDERLIKAMSTMCQGHPAHDAQSSVPPP